MTTTPFEPQGPDLGREDSIPAADPGAGAPPQEEGYGEPPDPAVEPAAQPVTEPQEDRG
jgi:hypothetical protein